MNIKNKKILLYSLAALAGLLGIAYGICYLIIVKNYNKVLSEQQAIDALEAATEDVETIEDINPTENVHAGSTLGNDDPNLEVDNTDTPN